MRAVKVVLASAIALAPVGTHNGVQAQARPPRPACEVANFKVPGTVTLVSAKSFATPVPYCRLDGYVTTTNPGPNHVRIMLALPQTWNGRYLFTVQGGAAGFVPDPTEWHLKQGYAVASTDKGTRAAHILDFSFKSDPAQSLDWGHRGVHVAALATQALAGEYYGRPTFHRYVMGCSGGGDGTLTEAELYPQDFDAFLPGAMAYPPHTMSMWGVVAQRVNRDPSSWISPDELKQVGQVIMKEFDASDGAIDGLIWDPRKIKLERASFPFLSDAQFGTLQVIQRGIPDIGGLRFPGYWLSNPAPMTGFMLGKTRPPWTSPEQFPSGYQVTESGDRGLHGEAYNTIRDMDYTSPAKMAEELKLRAGSGRTIFDPRRMAGIKQHGAKVIMWAGASDQAVPPQGIVDYSDEVTRVFGPSRSSFFRSFLAPGMYHCRGGEGQPTDFQEKLLDAAASWVETGKAPDFILASNAPRAADGGAPGAPAVGNAIGKPTRTYRICAYPYRSVFKGGLANSGKLDVNDAKNWSCQAG